VSPKSVVLICAAALVVAMAIYLFVQVRATPAQAGSPQPAESAPTRAIVVPPPATTAPPLARPPTASEPGSHQPNRADGEAAAPPPIAAGNDGARLAARLDVMMEQANKAYDRGDYDDAIGIAGKLLSKDPTNVRMLRILVSASCIQGDGTVAQQYYDKLPKFDRDQMKARCDRYGVTFKDPP
jgi:hypothetical protein